MQQLELGYIYCKVFTVRDVVSSIEKTLINEVGLKLIRAIVKAEPPHNVT